MRRSVLLLFVACGGGGSDTATSPPTTPTLTCPEGGLDAAEISEQALPTCAAVQHRYDDLLASFVGCEVDTDCQALRGQCSVGLGGCFEVTNICLAQEVLGEVGTLWLEHSEGCSGAVCDCPDEPTVGCDSGRCKAR